MVSERKKPTVRGWAVRSKGDYLPMSMMWMSWKPERARFFRISHPSPPAPLPRRLAWSGIDSTGDSHYPGIN